MKSVNNKFEDALNILYWDNNVGNSTEDKLGFWNTYCPTNIYGVESDEDKVLCYETNWLIDQFPSDFEYC